MEIKQDLIIHLIYMVSTQYEHIFRIIMFDKLKILVYGIGSTCIPLGIIALLIRRKNTYAADITVKVPGNSDSDMGIQTKRLILCKNSDCINTRN